MNDIDQPIANRWPLACLVLGISYLGAYRATGPVEFFPDVAAYVAALAWPTAYRYLVRLEIIELAATPRISIAETALPAQILALLAAVFSLYMPQVWSVPAAWLCLAATSAWHAAVMECGKMRNPSALETMPDAIPGPRHIEAGSWAMLPLAIPADLLTLLDVWYRRPGLPGGALAMVCAAVLFPLWHGFALVFRALARRWYAFARRKFADREDARWAGIAIGILLIVLFIIPFSMVGFLFIIFEMPKWLS